MRRIRIALLAGGSLAALAMTGPASAQDCSARLAEIEGRMTKLEPSSERRRDLQELIEAARVFEWMEREHGCLVVLSEAEGLLKPAEAAAEKQVERKQEAAADVAEGEIESMPSTEVPSASGMAEDEDGDAAREGPSATALEDPPQGQAGRQQPNPSAQPSDRQSAATQSPPSVQGGAQDQAATPEPDPGPLGEVPASELIGREVRSADGEAVAEVVDLVRQTSDRAMFAVVRVGGFLGLGAKEIALPLAELEPGQDDGLRLAGRTADELEQLPPYNPAQYVTTTE